MYPIIYVLAIVAANLSVAHFGAASTPFNAFLLIGLDMAIRDKLHESIKSKNKLLYIGALILTAGAISYALNPASGIIAVASLVAFVASALVDTFLYQKFIHKKYFTKCNISNTGSAAVDSILFPLIAFGAFMPLIVLGQFIAKVGVGFIWSLILKRFFK